MIALIKGAAIGFLMTFSFVFLLLLAETKFLWRYMDLSEGLRVCFGSVPAVFLGAFQFREKRLFGMGLLCGVVLAGVAWFGFIMSILISFGE